MPCPPVQAQGARCAQVHRALSKPAWLQHGARGTTAPDATLVAFHVHTSLRERNLPVGSSSCAHAHLWSTCRCAYVSKSLASNSRYKDPGPAMLRPACPVGQVQEVPQRPSHCAKYAPWTKAVGFLTRQTAKQGPCSHVHALSGLHDVQSAWQGRLAEELALTWTAQPKSHQVSGYSLAPSKQGACAGQPALPQCMRAPHPRRSTSTTPCARQGQASMAAAATLCASGQHHW